MEKDNRAVVIFDIDGTLADSSSRIKYLQPEAGEKKNWKKFFSESIHDEPLRHVLYFAVLLSTQPNLEIILLTGRPEAQRRLTEKWLEKVGCPYSKLYMRPDTDKSPDYISKLNIIRSELKDRSIFLAFEDRRVVAKAMEEAGIRTLLTSSEWLTKEVPVEVKSAFDNEEFRDQSQKVLAELNLGG